MTPFTVTDADNNVRFGVHADGLAYFRPDLDVSEAVYLAMIVICAMREKLREKCSIIDAMRDSPLTKLDDETFLASVRAAMPPRSRISRGSIRKVLDAMQRATYRSLDA